MPAVGAKYNNECYTLWKETSPYADERINKNLNNDADYSYLTTVGASTVTAPVDVLNESEFIVTICPGDYVQSWTPHGFNFDCPNADYTMSIRLPSGYFIDTLVGNGYLKDSIKYANSSHSNLYTYLPSIYYTDSTGCPRSKVDTLSPRPSFQELYTSDTTLIINFGKLDTANCPPDQIYTLTCMNIPFILKCDTGKHVGYTATLSFTLQYTCDPSCADCADELDCGSTTIYNHPCGSCNAVPNTTNTLLSIFRTNTGYINQNLPKYYTTSCSTLDSAMIPTSADTGINRSGINLGAAYQGDQVETIVEGSYSNFVPDTYKKVFLQISHPIYPGTQFGGYLFELDPDVQSYFIINGFSAPLTALNGVKLYLPIGSPFYTNTYSTSANTVYMHFSIDTAIYNTFPALYNTYKADVNSENINVTAYLHLRVWNPSLSTTLPNIIRGGDNVINLRNDYMALTGSGDSLHSCDSWGTRFNILQPLQLGTGLGVVSPSDCDSEKVTFQFYGQDGNPSGDDFPNEFRPFTELDSNLVITLPKGYIYGSSTFSTYIDKYNTSAIDNYFLGGANTNYFHVEPASNTNHLKDTNSSTQLTYIGLNNSCWPLIDQKNPYQSYTLTIMCKPICNVHSPSTFDCTTGSRIATQQSDTNFQIHFHNSYSDTAYHTNPLIKVIPPIIVSDFSRILSFKFVFEDSLLDATDAWVAFENPGCDTLNLSTASLENVYTHHLYFGHLYDGGNGILYNVGPMLHGMKDSLQFSAYIDSNSCSCPNGKYNGYGVLTVRYGSICMDTLIRPDSNGCENDSVQFDYHISPNDLVLDTTFHSPDTVSLCGGILTENFILQSADYGTIADPTFWIKPQLGFTVDTVIVTYPCSGGKVVKLTIRDTTSTTGTGETAGLGWILDKDLNINGLPGKKQRFA